MRYFFVIRKRRGFFSDKIEALVLEREHFPSMSEAGQTERTSDFSGMSVMCISEITEDDLWHWHNPRKEAV